MSWSVFAGGGNLTFAKLIGYIMSSGKMLYLRVFVVTDTNRICIYNLFCLKCYCNEKMQRKIEQKKIVVLFNDFIVNVG